jgi:uncharacterized protein with PIN domain
LESDRGQLGRGEVEMGQISERRKAELMQQMESLVDEFVDWTESTSEPNLTQIEERVLELRERFGQALAREAIEAQEAKRPVPGPRCPQCGEEMDYKGQKEVTPQTWVGKVPFERGYYYCKQCGAGLFPPR